MFLVKLDVFEAQLRPSEDNGQQLLQMGGLRNVQAVDLGTGQTFDGAQARIAAQNGTGQITKAAMPSDIRMYQCPFLDH
jgi:hypothetical protein